MSRGVWKCHECGHEVNGMIWTFFESCPKCKAKHEIVAWVKGLHCAHTIPLYKSVNESMDKVVMNGFFAFASGNGKIEYSCSNKEFYECIKKKAKGNPRIKVLLSLG